MAPTSIGQTTGPDFAALLRRHREAAALSQEALAEKAGLSARAISDLERGVKTRPHLETVRLLAEALRLDAAARAELAMAVRPAANPSGAATRSGVGELPSPVTPLIGREQAVTEIAGLVRGGGARLVTLIGPGGVGKTRLAIAAARALSSVFPQVGWVDLAALTDPSLVLPAMARSLGVPEAGNTALLTVVREHLRSRRALLVLDNCEHLLAALQPLIGDLLAICPDLAVLATSRTPLRLQGERLFPVVPLALPNLDRSVPIDALARNPAITLFAQRASAVSPDFALTTRNAGDIVQICARVDGLPLAIELIAVRVRTISPSVLVASLDKRLRLLTSGPADMPARHQTLRETLAWSHDLLSDAGRTAFRRLAVFAGGCTLVAATEVIFDGDVFAAMDGLAELVDHSLLEHKDDPDGEPRYQMLETVREFAWEQLAACGELASLRAAHATYFVTYAEGAGDAVSDPHRAALLDRLAAERNNFRAAFGWVLSDQAGDGDAELALRLAVALWPFWQMRGFVHEGHHWLEQAMGRQSRALPGTRARAFLTLANLANILGAPNEASGLYQASRDLYQEAGNSKGMAGASIGLGLIATARGDYAYARKVLQDSLALQRGFDDALAPVESLYALGCLANAEGQYADAETYFSEASDCCRQQGADVWLAYLALERVRMERYRGRREEAARWAAECLPRFREIGERRAEADTMMELGLLALDQGETERAVDLLRRAAASLAELHIESSLVGSLEGLVGTALASRQFELAAHLAGATATWRTTKQIARAAAEQTTFEEHLAIARRALGDDHFTRSWQMGQAMTLEQALAATDRLLNPIEDDRFNTGEDRYSRGSPAEAPSP